MLLPPSKVFACLTIVAIALGATSILKRSSKRSKEIHTLSRFQKFLLSETKGLYLPHSRNRPFKLKDGSFRKPVTNKDTLLESAYGLSEVSYGDATGDGQEEAIVVLDYSYLGIRHAQLRIRLYLGSAASETSLGV